MTPADLSSLKFRGGFSQILELALRIHPHDNDVIIVVIKADWISKPTSIKKIF